jgi:UDP-glucose 4-epimerase
VRDYLYVDDVVSANERALVRGGGAVVNLGTGVGTSVNQIFPALKDILAFPGEPIFEPARSGEVQRIYLDATRAAQELGWKPQVSFEDGLRRTVEWSRQAAAGVTRG